MPMATVKDIAERAGLGMATVSKYLNGGRVREQNRAAIEKAIRELGYQGGPRVRLPKPSCSSTVGVVIPELNNLYATTIVQTLEDELHKADYNVLVCDCRSSREREAELVRFLLGKTVDGLVCLPTDMEGASLAPVLEKGLPVLLLDRMVPDLQGRASGILVDNLRAVQQATAHLLDQGHRRIGLLLGIPRIHTTEQQLLGYQLALRQRLLDIDEDLVRFTDCTVRGGYEAAQELLRIPDVTALVASSDCLTLGALHAVGDRGLRLPDQLSFVGFDQTPLFQACLPKLTLVEQPLQRIGQLAAQSLLAQMSVRPERRTYSVEVLSTRLVLGETVAAPAARP